MLTRKDIQAAERYKERLRTIREGGAINPFETMVEKQARIERAKKDVRFFVETYFHHYATSESADFQIELANWTLRHRTGKAIVRWGRGLAKSVWCDTLIPLWLWINDDIHFMVIVGNNYDKAKILLSDIQAEFEANALLIHDFGQQVNAGNWTDGHFRTNSGFIAKALGMGQSPRGLRVGAQRPDYCVADDLDDKDTVKNPIRQREMANWIERDLIPTMDGPVRRYLHPNNNAYPSTIQGILEERHPKWKMSRIDACPGADRKPRWESKYPINYYKEIESEIGTLALEAEYNNTPHTQGEIFKEEYVVWDKSPRIDHFDNILAYWDVAYSEAKTADYNAIKVWGRKGDKFHMINAYVRQSTMGDALRWMFRLHKSLPNAVYLPFYYESQFWNEALMMVYQQVRSEFLFDLPLIKDDRPTRNKYERMLTMLPFYQQGRIKYNIAEKANNDIQAGLAQLMGIEPGYKGHDDSPDADSRALELLNQHLSASNYKEAEFGGNYRDTRY